MSEGIDKGEDRKGSAKLLGGRISCIVGILFGASASVSSGAVGAALGCVGLFPRREAARDSDYRARR